MTNHPEGSDLTDREIAALDMVFYREEAVKRLDSISQFAQAIWKGLTLVNGGAIVALFTLVGNTGVKVDRQNIWTALIWFVSGLCSCLASALLAYFVQSAFWSQAVHSVWNAQERLHGRPGRWQHNVDLSFRVGSVAEILALLAAAASLGCFAQGSISALHGVLPITPTGTKPAIQRPASLTPSRPQTSVPSP